MRVFHTLRQTTRDTYTYDSPQAQLETFYFADLSRHRPPSRTVSSPGRAPAPGAPAGAMDPLARRRPRPCAASTSESPQNAVLSAIYCSAFCDSRSPHEVLLGLSVSGASSRPPVPRERPPPCWRRCRGACASGRELEIAIPAKKCHPGFVENDQTEVFSSAMQYE